MDISTAISGDPCSEKLLPVGSTEILIQGESGDVYGNGPKTYILGGLVFLGAPPACCVNTRDMMWVDAGAGMWRKLREWAWKARGQTNATWGKETRVIVVVGTIGTVEWQK